jgi:DNA-3-methyladenine glycosylase II
VMRTLELEADESFDLSVAASYMQNAPGYVFDVVAGATILKAIRLPPKGAGYALLSVSQSEPGSPVVIEVQGSEIDEVDLKKLKSRVEETFFTSRVPLGLRDLLHKDPALQGLFLRHGVVRPVMYLDPYDSLLWAIACQQVNVAFAKTLLLRLHQMIGSKVLSTENGVVPCAPIASEVASLTISDLRALQFSNTKARALIETAEAICSGELILEELASVGYDVAVQRLTAYFGVGRWTAEYVLLRGLGYQDVFPSGDLGLKKIVAKLYTLQSPVAEVQIREISERWSPYRGWIAQLLFQHLNFG